MVLGQSMKKRAITTLFTFPRIATIALSALAVVFTSLNAKAADTSINVDVSGQCDPWLAGMPNGFTITYLPEAGTGRQLSSDTAPNQLPVFVPLPGIQEGMHLQVSGVTGSVSHGPYHGPIWDSGPDGLAMTSTSDGENLLSAEAGKSGLTAPVSSLLGLFLDDHSGTANPPPVLDFSIQGATDYSSLSPQLYQPFFIGDGLTASGAQQQISVPPGATRFYLGVMDGYEFSNNIGAFNATVTIVPEPSMCGEMAAGVIALLVSRRPCRCGPGRNPAEASGKNTRAMNFATTKLAARGRRR
jgi:hypothetical protein